MAEDQDNKKAREAIADLTSGFDKSVSSAKELLKVVQEVEQTVQRTAGHTGGDGTKSSFGGANASSSKTAVSANGNNNNYGDGSTNTGATSTGSSTPSKATNFFNMAANVTGSVVNAGVAFAGLFPTSQEALLNETAQARQGFYQGTTARKSDIGGTLNNIGTATSPLDAITAANSGAGMGLLPGLAGYGSNGFGGILGGAALVSNLVPGSGLTGGMGAMAALNQGGNVNRLRMLGINVRNASGSSMQDLPAIIGQLYNLLSNSGPVTAENIAVSAMSGNALDSILNQYFGGDANLRQAVISGLVQMANKKGESLYTSGSQSSLVDTGGSTASVSGISQRNASEYNMINNLTSSTISGLNQGNNTLTGMYNTIGAAGNEGLMGKTMGGMAQFKTNLEVTAGGRNGAVGNIYDTIASDLGKYGIVGNAISTLLSVVGLGAAASQSSTITPTGKGLTAPAGVSFNINIAGGVTQASAQTLGQTVANEINQRAILELASASAAANS